MKYSVVVFVVLGLIASQLSAQSEEGQEQIVEAKKLLREGNVRHDQLLLLQAWSVMERVYSSDPSPLTLYYLTYAEYELVRFGMSRTASSLFERYIGQAIEHAEQLVEQRKDWSESLALLSSLYGMKITKSWVQAPILGPKAGALADQGVEKDSANPRAWLVRGMMKFNTPSFFGGSVEEALVSFRKCVELFESVKTTEPLQPDWGYLDALAWTGRSFEKLHQLDSALTVYRKALEVESEFHWVKHILLPALEKKVAEKNRQEEIKNENNGE
jgi:tetratricopeptide (TPR) repeat protein